jgi:hypothetical protein
MACRPRREDEILENFGGRCGRLVSVAGPRRRHVTCVPNFLCLPSLPEISTSTLTLAPDRLYPANDISPCFSVYQTNCLRTCRTCRTCSLNRLAAMCSPYFQVTPWAGHLRRNRQPSHEASSCISICLPYKGHTQSHSEMNLYLSLSLSFLHASRRCYSNHSLLRLF